MFLGGGVVMMGVLGFLAALLLMVVLAAVVWSAVTARRPQLAVVPADPSGPADRLAQLQQLRDQGLVSDAEYAARRQAIVDGI